MRPKLIVKLDILLRAFAVALFRGVLSAVRLLFFKGSKKCFSHRIVMWPCRSGKRLLYIALLQERCKCGRGVLLSAVAVKSETAGIAAFPKSSPERAGDQVRACVAGYPMADDLAGEKIPDDTKVDPVVVDFKICDVTDPDLVGTVCGELPFQQVLLFILLTLFVLLFCIRANAVQVEFLHDRRNAFGADPDTALSQSDADLFSTKSLRAVHDGYKNAWRGSCCAQVRNA